jgi:hypothetical protein
VASRNRGSDCTAPAGARMSPKVRCAGDDPQSLTRGPTAAEVGSGSRQSLATLLSGSSRGRAGPSPYVPARQRGALVSLAMERRPHLQGATHRAVPVRSLVTVE